MLVDLKLGPAYDGLLFLAESVRNPPILQSHHHAELELNLVVRGTTTYVVGGKRFTFARRTLLWMFPAQEHQLVDRSSDAQYYVAVFKPGLIKAACRGTGYAGLKCENIESEGLLHTVLQPDSFDLIRKMMDHLMVGSLDPDLLNRQAGYGVDPDFCFQHRDPDLLNAGLRHLLLTCWQCHQSGRTGKDGSVALHPATQRALDILSGGTGEHNMARLARHCGVSENYLSRLFQREVGVPIHRYRNSLRLSRFWEAYRRQGRRTVSEAVYEAGFGSYAQFHRVFTAEYAQGPRECLSMTMEPGSKSRQTGKVAS